MVPSMESELPEVHNNDDPVVEQDDWFKSLFVGAENMEPVPQQRKTERQLPSLINEEPLVNPKRGRGRPPKTLAKPEKSA